MTSDEELRASVLRKDAGFWVKWAERTMNSTAFEELIFLGNLSRIAQKNDLTDSRKGNRAIRLALVGGYTLYPFSELLRQTLLGFGVSAEIFAGNFDNAVEEILDTESELYRFKPDHVFILPSGNRCRYTGSLLDDEELKKEAIDRTVVELLDLCERVHKTCNAEVILANFLTQANHDLGSYRAKNLASDWSFKRSVNLSLGLLSQSFVTICDVEFLGSRRGNLHSHDPQGWYESKQIGSPGFLVDLAREVAWLCYSMKAAQKKVLVLDLDNTLWGGVIGEDGLFGIELGDTSPRAEAYKDFQKYILTLQKRGVLLAVCSKNDHSMASEPFEKHPEMILRPEHFVSFKSNWKPKSENILEIASELNLCPSSFVFVDDNPAEIEIVRQFVPEVSAVLLGPDPSGYVTQLQNLRWFEPRSLTGEDVARTDSYQSEAKRERAMQQSTDMPSYLRSLEMKASLSPFNELDASRIAQLINKSNQFNLTTRRRSEAEVLALIGRKEWPALSVRLLDRFGDHGLIAVVITEVRKRDLWIDTWLMSCRVLKRQVEELTLNEIFKVARHFECERVVGVLIPTDKNQLVQDLYEKMGFEVMLKAQGETRYQRDVKNFREFKTEIDQGEVTK